MVPTFKISLRSILAGALPIVVLLLIREAVQAPALRLALVASAFGWLCFAAWRFSKGLRKKNEKA
jgi:hypothetical protein